MGNANKSYTIVVSNRAAEQLVSHVRFVAQVSEEAAEKLRQDILQAITSLESFPERNGWMEDPSLPRRKYRKMSVGKRYLLIYQLKDKTIYLDYVLDCRQDYQWLI